MKQVYIILSDDYTPQTMLACTSFQSAEAIAGHIFGDYEKGRRQVRRIPLIVDNEFLFDNYNYTEPDEEEE